MTSLFDHLLQSIPPQAGKQLWCLGDGANAALPAIKQQANTNVLTNRFDVHQAALLAGVTSLFNDWTISLEEQYDTIVLPTVKEKAVMHHLINQSAQLLPINGVLCIAGEKTQGTKTYIEKASKLLGQRVQAKKYGTMYLGHIQKIRTPNEALDSQNYPAPRTVQHAEIDFISKPGVFGWNKVDLGSQFFLEHLQTILTPSNTKDLTLVDLGCGWGYLVTQTKHLAFGQRIATDNNAAALQCVALNSQKNGLVVDIIASNIGDGISAHADIVLCNPPFHSGFEHACELTESFVKSAARLLRQNKGTAYFVVNSFIGVEKIAEKYFARVETLANNNKFKVLKLSKNASAY